MTRFSDLFAALAAPFANGEVKQRSQASRQFSYITARTVMNRLDVVLGPENWWDEYQPLEHSVLCRLYVRLPDGQVLCKSDAGGNAGMSDQGDDDKSAFSDAFKRAAVKFGVGRYLYGDGVPQFAGVDDTVAEESAARREPKTSKAAAAPKPDPAAVEVAAATAPRHGRALFAWVAKLDDRHGIHLRRHLNLWAKSRSYPSRMIEWDPSQVSEAFDEARSRLQELGYLDESATPADSQSNRVQTLAG